MIETFKKYSWLISIVIFGATCFFYGAHVERLEADKEIADLRAEYAENERNALRQAEQIRQEQEQEFLEQMAALKRDVVERTADADRVRKQFNQLKSRSSSTLEQCNRRAGRWRERVRDYLETETQGSNL